MILVWDSRWCFDEVQLNSAKLGLDPLDPTSGGLGSQGDAERVGFEAVHAPLGLLRPFGAWFCEDMERLLFCGYQGLRPCRVSAEEEQFWLAKGVLCGGGGAQ